MHEKPLINASALQLPFYGCNGAPIFFWYGLNLIAFVSGLLCLLLYKLVLFLLPNKSHVAKDLTKLQKWYIKFHLQCEQLATACNVPGKILIIVLSALNQISWTIDVVELSLFQGRIADPCHSRVEKLLVWIDFIINLYFLIHFIIRLISANNKIRFWFQLSSLVDLMTVPSSLFAVIHPRERLLVGSVPVYGARALNFVRALRFITYTDALVYLGVLKDSRHIRLSQLIFTFVGVWCTGSGLMFVIENAGDFWADKTNAQPWTYWEANYFLLVTMSTVGYGDYYSKTLIGRIFVCLFILSALAMFASSIPEILSIVSETKLSTSEYQPCHGQRHVVVCGGCDSPNMKTFLKGFFHQDNLSSTSRLLKMVIVCPECDMDLRVVFKHFAAWIHRFDGSIVLPANLGKIRISEAEGVIMLSKLKTEDTEKEDSVNMMNIMAVKIARPNIRIVTLLHRYKNKFLLHNFLLWKNTVISPDLNIKPDLALCLEELKMGLLAQNCVAPGASTLLVNLMINIAAEKPMASWRGQYEYGAANEIYGVNFSPEYENLPFKTAAMICYKRWGVGLVAVDVILSTGKRRLIINPSSANDFVIKPKKMRAFVLAQDQSVANKLLEFCYSCQFTEDKDICSCKTSALRQAYNLGYTSVGDIRESFTVLDTDQQDEIQSVPTILEGIESTSEDAMYDITGSFHWCQSVDIEDATMTPLQARTKNFKGHIIICFLRSFDDSHDFSIGLCNFVMPLRFHYIEREKLKDIVVIGDKKFIQNHEWTALKNFPNVFIIDGHALNSAHLTIAGIHACEHCVIISASKNPTHDREMADKNALLCGMSVLEILATKNKQATVEIINEENLHYFSSGGEYEEDCTSPIQLTEPFSRGVLFCTSVLFSTISSAYYSPEGLSFILSLISGASAEVERMIGEGFGLMPEDPKKRTLRYGCRLSQLSMFDSPFSDYISRQQETPNYGQLFLWAMSQCGIFCLGLYRLRGEKSIQGAEMHFVYTNPPPKTLVVTSDRIFCLIPPTFHPTVNLDTNDL